MEIRHSHKWTLYSGSGFGRVYKLRHCEDPDCNIYETYMYDISKKALVWVPGNFFEDTSSPIYIIAESHEAFIEVVNQLPEEMQKDCLNVRNASDLDLMKQYHQPRWIPAKDWKETALSDRSEFMYLCATGHF